MGLSVLLLRNINEGGGGYFEKIKIDCAKHCVYIGVQIYGTIRGGWGMLDLQEKFSNHIPYIVLSMYCVA